MKKNIQIFVLFCILVGITALLLARSRTSYVLGKPGVNVADIPTYAVIENQTNVLSPVSVVLPEKPLDCVSQVLNITQGEVQMLPPDTVYGRRMYTASDGMNFMISVVLMGTDRTSIHKPQYCLTGQGETIIGSEVITIPISKPHPYDLKLMKLTTKNQHRLQDGRKVPTRGLFLYWFVADGQLTPYHGERMWLMGRDLLTKGLLQRWAYVAYWGVCYPGQEDALLKRMKELIVETVPEFQTTTGEPSPRAVAFEPNLAQR
jgi:hypothetical protein